jgi:hypothetical protein
MKTRLVALACTTGISLLVLGTEIASAAGRASGRA